MSQPINPHEARAKLDEGAAYLDVRTPGEFATGHVPGAVNIPLDHLQERYDDLPKEGELIIGCASGGRSSAAIELLEGNVSCELYNLDGGYSAWQDQGLPIAVDDNAPWSLDRQVMFTAGSVALAGLMIGKVVPPVRKLSWLVAAGLVYSGASGNCYLKKLLMKAEWNQNPDAWQDTAANLKYRVKSQARDVGHQVGEKARDYGQQAADKAREAAHNVKTKISRNSEPGDSEDGSVEEVPAGRI